MPLHKSAIKTKEEIDIMREAGSRLAFILNELGKKVKPGITPLELDRIAEDLIKEEGDIPTFKGYKTSGADRAYPHTLCVSPNDTVVHGIPNDVSLKEGDIVTLDIGLTRKGFVVDMACTFPVGSIDARGEKLIEVTKEALHKGIQSVSRGSFVGDVGAAVGTYVRKNGFEIVKELGGHGVGRKLHENPYIPNFGTKGTGEKLYEGMTLAIEPIVTEGEDDIELMNDGWTLKTRDGKRVAQFEHTILVTKKGAEILTK